MKEVHREHAITGILFTVASMFLDIIEDKLGNFPLLFLYGPPSSGKDQLIECCQSFFGIPQTPIHIGNKISTSKAQVRKFAQFRNIIVHLSEYRPGDQMLDELLKGFWDRRGYERGTIDSSYGTETVPINSSVIFTGNHYPDDDALITRVIAEEMVKTDFGPKEKKAYQELKDMYKSGISYITAEMVQHRKIWEDRFKETFRKVEGELKSDLEIAATHDRLISNVAVLGATYELMKDVVLFPFAYNDFVSHIRKGLDNQLRKLNTASVSMKWWDCLLAAIRTKQDPLRHGREFEVKDDKLYFNFTHTYNRVATQWWAQYHENVPGKSKISDMIKKDRTFIEEKSCHYMENNRTSVWVVDLTTIPIKNDLNDAIEWQKMEGTDIPVRNIAPATPDIFSDNTLLPENNRPF
jgi:DNA primase